MTVLPRDLSSNRDPYSATELSLLDALVQLRAQVPAAALLGPLDRWPIPTLILMDKPTGDADGIPLQRFSNTTAFEWQAIANLLLRRKPTPTRFASQLVDHLRRHLTVFVIVQENVGFSPGGSGTGSEEGCNAAIFAPGFPPLPDYEFAMAGPGVTILSAGPETVYYIRRIQAPSVVPCKWGGRGNRATKIGWST